MKLLSTALLSASAMVLIAPMASAQSPAYRDCETEREGRQVAGAVIGGILGAIIGNELADDSNNRPSYRRGHHGPRRGHYRRHDRGNAEEVGTLAGAGVGALIGAGIAGGEDCNARSRGAPYDRYPGKPSAGGYDDTYYRGQDSYQDYGSGYGDDYGYAGGQDSYSSGQLLGANPAGGDVRVYNAGAPTEWNCQWSQTRRMGEYGQAVTEQVYMCQGADNIWRPYDTYTR